MEKFIKNYKNLAISPQRKQVLDIVEAGFAAINTQTAIGKNFFYNTKKQILQVGNKKFDLRKFKRVVCVGFGKVALSAVTEIQKILKEKIACGFVIDLKEGSLGNIVCKVGTHPYPTMVNVQATKELVEILKTCEAEDLVICVVSGGGSALLCDPHDMTCEQQSEIIASLTVKGANIFELNTVRKHISKVKGGQLAKIIFPATCISLIFSDVPGDDLGVIASGPTVKDQSTTLDAKRILEKYKILQTLNLPGFKLLETPKENKYFKNIYNFLVVSPKHVLMAMKDKALELGFETKIYSSNFQGIAKELGPKIVKSVSFGECVLGAGESTVKIVGKGKGGRNQEMALSALPFLQPGQAFACVASDGHDNTDSAGAIVDEFSLQKATKMGLNVEESLNNNDSFTFFETTADQIQTGLTGLNVSDFFVCLRK